MTTLVPDGSACIRDILASFIEKVETPRPFVFCQWFNQRHLSWLLPLNSFQVISQDLWWQLDLTRDLFSPADHEDQFLVCQVGEGHHHAGLSEGLLQVLHEVDLWRLRLHDAWDELLWAHGWLVYTVHLWKGRVGSERSLQMEMPLRAQPQPDQSSACGIPRLESTPAVSGSSMAAAFTPYTCSMNTATDIDLWFCACVRCSNLWAGLLVTGSGVLMTTKAFQNMELFFTMRSLKTKQLLSNAEFHQEFAVTNSNISTLDLPWLCRLLS